MYLRGLPVSARGPGPSLRVLADRGQHEPLTARREPVEVDELRALGIRAGGLDGSPARARLELPGRAGLEKPVGEMGEVGGQALERPDGGDLPGVEALQAEERVD